MDESGRDRGVPLEEWLERWLDRCEADDHTSLDEFLKEVPEEHRAALLRLIEDHQAGASALDDLWDGLADPGDDFLPLGVPGRYVDLEVLHQGGMGVLCRAYDVELERWIAYKVMKPVESDAESARILFWNEPVITARLHHPGIVPIFARLEDATSQPAYAMELVEGPTLLEAIHEYQALLPGDRDHRASARKKLLEHFIATCRIVAYAHERNIAHGDIKPSNIKIDTKFESTRLIDWGLACVVGADKGETSVEEPTKLVRAAVPSTPLYDTPSIREGKLASKRRDLHALGVTLIRILAEPIDNDAAEIDAEALRPAPDAPAALWAITGRTRHPERDEGYENASALADDVARFLEDKPVAAYRDPWTTRVRRWIGRHQTLTTASVLTTLLIALGITFAAQASAARSRTKLLEERRDALAKELRLTKQLDKRQNMLDATIAASLINRGTFRSHTTNAEVIRSLLALFERQDQDPREALEVARGLLKLAEETEALDARANERLRTETGKTLRSVIQHLEELVRTFPDRRDYRVSLARYYINLGVIDSHHVTNLTEVEGFLSGRKPLKPEQQAELETNLAWFDKALATLPADGEDLRDDRSDAWSGRFAILLQLGRFTEALMALEYSMTLADKAEQKQYEFMRSPILMGAEVEQSHLPWSRPPRVDHAMATRMAEYLAEHEGVSQAAVYNAACAFSQASVDEKANAAERQRRADRAVAYLKRIADQGYFKPRLQNVLLGKNPLKELLNDSDLDPLRSRDDFQALVAKLKAR